MTRFSYQGTDQKGQPVDGTIDAHDANGAIQRLAGRGVRISRLQRQLPEPPASRTAPKTGYEPVRTLPRPAAVTPGPAATVIRVRRVSRRDQAIALFSLASLLRSGQNPVNALDELAKVTQNPGLAAALLSAGEAAQAGLPISDALRCYPDALHDSAVGLIAAGEKGGFLPDAVQTAAQQAQDTDKLARGFWWAKLLVLNSVLLIPGLYFAGQSLLSIWDQFDPDAGGNPSAKPVAAVSAGFLDQFLWRGLPVIALVLFLTWVVRLWWMAPAQRKTRDRVGLRWPHFGQRARFENLSVFTWSLARLSAAGIAPADAWRMATDTAPNIEVRRILLDMGVRMREGTKLSQATQDPRLFPPAYGPMLLAAETTGDVTGALDQLAQIQRGDMESAEQVARFRGGRWGCALLLATTGIGIAIFYHAWMVELPARVLQGFEP